MRDQCKRAVFGWRRLAAAACCLAAFACTAGPPSADVLLGGSATPQAAVPMAGPMGPFDGLYSGTAQVTVNGNMLCPLQMRVSNFRVQGNVVQFGGFRAPIAPDGTVTNAAFEGMFLTGRFVGAQFTGTVEADENPALYARPLKTCVYAIEAARIGS